MLQRGSGLAEALNTRIGRAAAWATLLLVLLQFAVVVARYAFGLGSVWAQEAIVYVFAAVMTLTAGWALVADAHVRVDIFYRDAPPRRRAAVDLVGTLVFLLPMMAAVIAFGWPYVRSSWAILERSRETSGIPAVFLLKSLMLVYALLLVAAGLAVAVKAVAVLRAPRPAADAP